MIPAATLALLLAAGPGAHADPPAIGAAGDSCTTVPAMPAIIRDYHLQTLAARTANRPYPRAPAEAAKAYSAWQRSLRDTDFAGQCRYREANRLLGERPEVVFFGDSITEAWPDVSPGFFPARWINRGIAGQTTAQMIGRFRADVIDLHPASVHILAGINDIAGATGPATLDQIAGNIASMAELARLHGIRVVLGTLLPAGAWQGDDHADRAAAVAALNDWLRRYAAAQGITLIDYHPALVAAGDGMAADLSADGIHPNARGYTVMERTARAALP
ncbi:GDSL-type esterase/lipase family protein (plasmid) [Croceibacterium sp. TMG7-5b_MA50]|uniref:GDSL-type esterase/lipase family protein n=1 Tax=Croceibacterium sp. TMG7-5b_MA50 TaxID=3121290 RepID=UPI0032219EFF